MPLEESPGADLQRQFYPEGKVAKGFGTLNKRPVWRGRMRRDSCFPASIATLGTVQHGALVETENLDNRPLWIAFAICWNDHEAVGSSRRT